MYIPATQAHFYLTFAVRNQIPLEEPRLQTDLGYRSVQQTSLKRQGWCKDRGDHWCKEQGVDSQRAGHGIYLVLEECERRLHDAVCVRVVRCLAKKQCVNF